jgi:hypothetical protein
MKFISLTILVNSLTKGEKRHFKLSSTLQQGEKDYLRLFNYIENGTPSELIKSEFLKDKPNAAFEVACSYLYKSILETIYHLKTEKDLTTKLTTDILKAKILFEKGLYDDGFKRLKNIQLEAEKEQLTTLQQWAYSLEIEYISSLNFHTISETELIKKQQKIQVSLKNMQHIYQHNALYQLLHHRLIYKGNVRTKEQKEELNDLLISELGLIARPFAQNFESQKTHFLFQAYYLISTGDYQSALKTFYELTGLFDQNEYMWIKNPIDYLVTIEGILDSLKNIKKFEEMNFFLAKLESLPLLATIDEINKHRIVFTYQVIKDLENGNFEKAQSLKKSYQETLFNNLNLLDFGKQAEVFLYSALIYMVAENPAKAHQELNHILLKSKLFQSLPIYRTFRLIHLMVHFELGNNDYIQHEIRSIKRGLNGYDHKSYLLEKIIFKFLMIEQLPSLAKEKTILWKKIEKEFEKIELYKYEIQLLNIFNFKLWIKAKIFRSSLAILVKDFNCK